jgi:hypothetical protein
VWENHASWTGGPETRRYKKRVRDSFTVQP